MGREDRPEDHPYPGEGRAPPGTARLPGRRRGRAYLRADPDLPGPPPRRPDFLQRGAAIGSRAAGLPPVRTLTGRLGVLAGADRRRRDGRRQGVDVRRLAADGRDGHRREDRPRSARRRPDALRGVGVRGHPRRVGRGGHRGRPALSRLHAPEPPRPGARRRHGRSGAGPADRRDRALRPAEVLRHARGHPRARGRGLVARDEGALRSRDHHRASRASADGRSGSSRTSPRSRAASSSSTPPTRRRDSSGSATPTTFPSCTSRTCRDSWSARRSSGRGSSGTAPR